MKTTPEVSVIIPVYNAEKWLRECLDSVRGQTLEDLEIICVDDGSTDSSPEILREYAEADERFTVITQPNKNAGAARNNGLEHASGKYLSFLDADDVFDREMLADASRKLEKTGADVVCFAARQLDMRAGELTDMPWSLRTDLCPDKEVFSPSEMAGKLFNAFQNWAWNKLFRRSFIEEQGLRFQEIPRTNDMYFTCMALALAKGITIIPRQYVTYRVGMGGSLQQTNTAVPTAFWDTYKATKKGLEEKGLYQVYRKSFMNWVLEGTIYNYNSVKGENGKEQIAELIRSEGEKEFGFVNEPFSFYELPDWPERYLEICGGNDPETVSRRIEGLKEFAWTNIGESRREADALRAEVEELNRKIVDMSLSFTKKLKADKELLARVAQAEAENAALRQELDSVYSSVSFKTGRALTMIPRKVRDGLRRG